MRLRPACREAPRPCDAAWTRQRFAQPILPTYFRARVCKAANERSDGRVSSSRPAAASAPGGRRPKQYRAHRRPAVIARTLDAFLAHAGDRADRRGHPSPTTAAVLRPRPAPAIGRVMRRCMAARRGRIRCGSGCGLRGAERRRIVLIHDAVRPFVDGDLIDRVHRAPSRARRARCPGAAGRRHAEARRGATADRGHGVARRALCRADAAGLRLSGRSCAAHRTAARRRQDDFTDDAAIAEWAGICRSSRRRLAGQCEAHLGTGYRHGRRAALSAARHFPDVRTGNGYDVHAFEPGDHVTLCGVAIPHDKQLSGHSDADVALHALTDALLATCGAGDIGTHFPPSDPQWKGAASRIFVEHAAQTGARARRPHRQCRRHADLRGAAHRAAPRGDAAASGRDARRSPPTASRSRRPPTRSSASSAARKASRRSPPPRVVYPGEVPE